MKIQFKMMLDKESADRLANLARRFNRRSGQAVAEEVIQTYLPIWIEANLKYRPIPAEHVTEVAA
jgi:hypothetical protein